MRPNNTTDDLFATPVVAPTRRAVAPKKSKTVNPEIASIHREASYSGDADSFWMSRGKDSTESAIAKYLQDARYPDFATLIYKMDDRYLQMVMENRIAVWVDGTRCLRVVSSETIADFSKEVHQVVEKDYDPVTGEVNLVYNNATADRAVDMTAFYSTILPAINYAYRMLEGRTTWDMSVESFEQWKARKMNEWSYFIGWRGYKEWLAYKQQEVMSLIADIFGTPSETNKMLRIYIRQYLAMHAYN